MTAPPPSDSYDVLVVGAGPSGLSTAVTAARAGARVLVIDRHRGTSIFPKATGIRPRTMEILRSWGLEERVRAGHQPVRVAAAVSATLADPRQQEFSLGAPDPETLARVSPCTFAISPQDHLEPLLLEHLRAHGGAVRFDTELMDLVALSKGHLAQLRSSVAGSTDEVRASYVVGADGADSTVRRLVGVGVRHLGSEGEHLAMLFRSDLTDRIAGRRYALHWVMTEGDEGVFVPSGTAGRWLYDRAWHPESGETLEDWPEHRSVDVIRRAAGMPDLDVELVGVFPWSFGASVATSVRVGDVFLVGDAAHRATPRGATGMNTGIADGHNLGWKLAWVVRGWAGTSLLDSYAEERYPVGLHNALGSLQESGPHTTEDLDQDFGVVYSSGVIAPARRAIHASPTERLPGAVPGARAPHAWVEYAGRRVSTLDLFEGKLTLVAGSHDRWLEAVTQLAAKGLPLVSLAVDRDITDASGELEGAYALAPGDAVLVRPDGHIAWRSSGQENAGGQPRSDLHVVLDDAIRTALGCDPAEPVAPELSTSSTGAHS